MGGGIIRPERQSHAEEAEHQQRQAWREGNRDQEGDEQEHLADEKRFAANPVGQTTEQGRPEQDTGQRCCPDKSVPDTIKLELPGNQG